MAFVSHLLRTFEDCSLRRITLINARIRGIDQAVKVARLADKRRPHDNLVVICAGVYPAEVFERGRSQKKLVAISIAPCIEALLLRMHADEAVRSADAHRQAFIDRFGAPADSGPVLKKHFTREIIEAARLKHQELQELLALAVNHEEVVSMVR